MEKQELKEQWTEETIREYVKQAAESEPIPDKLQPKQMEKWLKQAMEEKGGRSMKEKKEKKSYRKWWCATASAAAFLAVVLFAAGRTIDWERGVPKELETKQSQEKAAGKETEKGASYQELYDAFSDIWKEQDKMTAYVEERSTDSAGADTGGEGGAELFAESTVEDAGAENSSPKESSGSKDYGKTNQQEAEVEEADIIKNDGRYLYQVVFEDRTGRQAVQIADTRDGLKEASRIEEFDHEIQQIYVWKDSLVVVESGWVNEVQEEDKESGNFLDSVKGVVDEMFSYGPGEDYREMSYSKIHIYNIEDRKNPELYHTFTLKGTYRDSRISDGYLYFFTACNAYRPRLEKDYQA